jgi:crotonobetainyl-CoA:carnitine CoA-transferase CaiB-like acyl-CoA transferase
MEDYFAYTAKLFNPDEANAKPEALKGLRVLDFSTVIFGPIAARLLADYGAEVIKLELPFYGDLWRPRPTGANIGSTPTPSGTTSRKTSTSFR